jgi:hypothetical protein
MAAAPANAMGTMLMATGPLNYACEKFVKAKPKERALVLAWAQGYFAALNQYPHDGETVNLQDRWRELNELVIQGCSDKSNPNLYRTFVVGIVYEALQKMGKQKD